MCADEGEEPVGVNQDLYLRMVDALTKQNIYTVTAARKLTVAFAVARLPEIFRKGLPSDKVVRSFARVATVPYDYVKQLKTTKNYDKIAKVDKDMMESDKTFHAGVEEAAEHHFCTEQFYNDLKWPAGEDPKGRETDDLRPIIQQRSLLIACPVRLAAMKGRIAAATKKRKKDAAAARAKEAKNKAAVELLEKSKDLLAVEKAKTKDAEKRQKEETKKRKDAEQQLKKVKAQLAAALKQGAGLRQISKSKSKKKQAKSTAATRRDVGKGGGLEQEDPTSGSGGVASSKRRRREVDYKAMDGGSDGGS